MCGELQFEVEVSEILAGGHVRDTWERNEAELWLSEYIIILAIYRNNALGIQV